MLEFSSLYAQKNIHQHWLFLKRPVAKEQWTIIDSNSKQALTSIEYQHSLDHTIRYSNWQWPAHNIHFISDLHADAEALIDSLILADSIKKTGVKTTDFMMTHAGKKAQLIIGGDCLDKGPSNLTLLRTLNKLKQLNKNTIILAGNHDMRLYMGLKSLFNKQSITEEHFFIRMGVKVLPLFKEIYDEYIVDNSEFALQASLKFCQQSVFPSTQWKQKFIQASRDRMSSKALSKELKRLHKKQQHFESDCLEHGLSLPMVYQAAEKCYSLFLEPQGEFYWFFDTMKLIHRESSFLFLHAGIDDKFSKILQKSNIDKINQLYQNHLHNDLCEFYYGTIGNVIRTKYRSHDPNLSHKGVKRLHRHGIHALVHGHVSQSKGQNIQLRSGLLHFECDVTLDKNSRKKEALSEYGAGVTSISNTGKVIGVSCDASQLKVFKP